MYIGPNLEIIICVREDEIFHILKAFHEQPCGGHFADRRTGHKELRMGYYWSTLFRDTKKYVQSCDSYQRMGQPNRLDQMPLQPQLVVEPFDRWALHLFVLLVLIPGRKSTSWFVPTT